MHAWLAGQLDCIALWHGVALIFLASVCLRTAQPQEPLPWRWLGLFGLVRAATTWWDLLSMSFAAPPVLQMLRTAVMAAGYLLLVEFGRTAWRAQRGWAPGRWVHGALLGLTVAVGCARPENLKDAVLCILGLPAAALAGGVLLRAARQAEQGQRGPLRIAGVALWAYGLAMLRDAPPTRLLPSALAHAGVLAAAWGPLLHLVQATCLATLALALSRTGKGSAGPATQSLRRGLVTAVMLMLLVGGGWVVHWFGQAADQRLRNRILWWATEIAETINPQLVKALSFTPEDRTKPEFERLRRQLTAFGQVIQQRSIYSMAVRDGGIVFGPESIAENDPLASPPGTVYEEPTPGNWEVLRTGEPYTEGPCTDEYGTFVSAFAPVRDPRGNRVLMVVGLDILVDNWQAEIARHRLAPLAFILVLALILLVGTHRSGEQAGAAPTRHAWLAPTDAQLTGAFGIVLTVGVALLAHRTEADSRRETFGQMADALAGVVGEALETIRDERLGGLTRFLESHSDLAEEPFRTYAQSVVEHAAVRALAWAPHVRAVEARVAEAQANANAAGAWPIRAPDAQGWAHAGQESDRYYPIRYVEPLAGNAAQLGFDLGSARWTRGALDEAVQTRLATATDLVISGPSLAPQRSLWVYDPVFASETHAAEGSPCDSASDSVRGLAVAIVDVQAVLNEALARSDPQNTTVDIELFALQPSATPQWLTSWPASATDHPHVMKHVQALFEESDLSAVFPLFELGKAYAIVVRPTPAFLAAHPARAGCVALLAGLVLMGGVTGLVAVMGYRRTVWEREVAARTAALEATRQANELVRLEEIRAKALLELSQMTQCSREQIAEYALEAGVQLTDSEIGYIGFTSDDEAVLNIAHYSKTAMAQCAMADKPFMFVVRDTGLLGEAIRQRKPIITNQYDDPRRPQKGTPPGHVPLQRHLGLPVFDGGRIVVVAGVGNKETPYTAQDVTQLSLLMDGMWRTLCRKQVEEQLRTNEERFRTLVANIPGVVFRCEVNPPWPVHFCSGPVLEISGYPASDFTGGLRTYPSVVHPDDLPFVEASITAAVDERRPYAVDHRICHADGSVRWVHARGQATYDRSGTALWLDGVILDDSERRRAEDALRSSEKRFMDVLYASSDAILLIDGEKFVDCNDATARMLGYSSRPEFLMLHPSELSPPTQPDGRRSFNKANEMMEAAYRKGFHRFEWVHLRANGEEFPVEVSLTPIAVQGKNVLHCVWRDITDRKQAELNLQQASEHQMALNRLQQDLLGPGALPQKLQKISDGAVRLFDVDFCRVWVTGAGDLCTGGCVHAAATDGPHLCGDRARCLHLVSSSGRYAHTHEAGHQRVPFGVCKIGRVASGVERKLLTNHAATDPQIQDRAWVQALGLVAFAGYQLRSTAGETIGVLALFSKHPITPEIDAMLETLANTAAQVIQRAQAEDAQRSLQNQLAQAQRLEAVGQLAAGIAHEINTPAQFVSDNTTFLRDAFPKLQHLLGEYRQLLDACRRGPVSAQLLKELEDAVKKTNPDYLVAQIPEAVADSLEGLERITKIVRAMKDFAHPGQQSLAPADLNRAIESTVTVARNEWKYVADMQLDLDPNLPPVPCLLGDFNQVILNLVVNAAHAIKDTAGEGRRDKGTIVISTHHDGARAEIRVRDTGTGIRPEHRDRIFDPFFTTKGVGKGTGQGLTIARRVIVEKHGGEMRFETEVGRGTTFIIHLPLTTNGVELKPVRAGVEAGASDRDQPRTVYAGDAHGA
jgi:PAS domain S-box-containing protein